MGQDVSTILTYGIAFYPDDDKFYSLPWNKREFDGSCEHWWRSINNYVNPYNYHDENGYKIDNTPDEQIHKAWEYHDNWLEENPQPFKIYLFGGDGDSQIISSPKYYYKEVDWGFEYIDISKLTIEEDEQFTEFVRKYIGDYKPQWILAAKLF